MCDIRSSYLPLVVLFSRSALAVTCIAVSAIAIEMFEFDGIHS